LGLAFVPLFWTAATFSRLSLERTERASALHLGQAIGRAIAEGQLDPELIPPILGLRFCRTDGTVLSLGVSAPRLIETSPCSSEPSTRSLDTPPHSTESRPPNTGLVDHRGFRKLIWSSSRGHDGIAHVGVTLNDPGPDQKSFVGLLALYMGLLGLGLLLAIYLALTFLIVRPLDELGRAARRVTHGTRPISLPNLPARELTSLGQSLEVMTKRLLTEERALKSRIEEVYEANERLKQAQERLLRSERLASVGRLAAGLAHELGNPISAMMGLEELILQGGLSPDEERDFLRRIQSETERVHRILRDLLDFARPTTKTTTSDEDEPGDVCKAVDETLALVRPQKVFREVSVITDLPGHLPLVILSRPKLVQVLLNLLLNAADALDHSDATEVTLLLPQPSATRNGTDSHGRSKTIWIEAFMTPEGSVGLSVTDNGLGVPIEIRKNLFEPFVTTKDVGKGTGLGLAVCRGLVEAASGTLMLDEHYTDGAKFVVTLPVAET
jgi:signal transduction histidine kinase